MSDHENETPVIFRRFEDGEVMALFPATPGGQFGECQSYVHVGQHGAADYGLVIRMTEPAAPAEYTDLQAELVDIGYTDLRVFSREQPWMHRARIDAHVKITRPRGSIWTTTPTCPT